MLSSQDVIHVVKAIIPLYVTMILAYVCVKWRKLFTAEQCAGINKFVAKVSIPVLSFEVVSSYNAYKMSFKLMCADIIQKVIAFAAIAAILKLMGTKEGLLRKTITGFSLSTLPNTLILGLPLLTSMYGDEARILAQIIVLQSVIWYNILLFLYELDVANTMSLTPPLSSQFPEGRAEDPEEAKDEEAAAEEEGRTEKKWKTILLILATVGMKLITNPNAYGTLLGLIWSSIHFRWGIHMPSFINQSVLILANGGLGMAMFSLGLFMASQCDALAWTKSTLVMIMLRFLLGPALMAVASLAVGLRGTLLKASIVQAALPLGIVPFVFAKEYNVHPAILSTGVILGMLIAMPIAMAYFFFLSL